jgi:hypothetical protein
LQHLFLNLLENKMLKPKKSKPVASKLLQAMQFLSVCQDSKGNDAQTHCSLQDHNAIAFDGVIAAGIRIDEDLNACPQTEKMVMALTRCGANFAITQLSPEMLQVRSDEFEAYIPCVKRERLPAVNPYAPSLRVSDSLIQAITAVAPLTSEKGDALEAASIQICSNSVLATDRSMVMEVWHGLNLPVEGFLLPKVAAVALGKIKKSLVGIGFKPTLECLFGKEVEYASLTFWFEDQSWFRTNLFKGKWREDAVKLLKLPSANVKPIPATFFETVAKVAPFSQDGKMYCEPTRVNSHSGDQMGAGMSLPVEHGPSNKVYKTKNLMLVGKHCNTMDESQGSNFTMFYGGNVRCAVWHDELIGEDIPF